MLYKREYIENNKKLKEENKRLNAIINGLDNTIENLEETIKGYEHKQYITDLITENGIICQKNKEIERLKKENEELKHKLKLINSYVYGCNIDSLGSDKE